MATIQPTLLHKLERLPSKRLAEVEDFVEFLTQREARATAGERLGEALSKLDALESPAVTDAEIEAEIQASRRGRAARSM